MIYILPTDTCYGIACSIDDIKSYEKIYKMKNRDFNKPLAIMVKDFKWLNSNTDLSLEQIKYLKDYKKPFTILTNSDSISLWLNFQDENGVWFINRDEYKKVAIRIANNETEVSLIQDIWPVFLTSANLTWKEELYNIKDVEKEFEYYIKTKKVKLLSSNKYKLPIIKTSDIFEFDWDSLDVKYLRQN